MPPQNLIQEKLTPADDLREILGQCELQVVALKGSGAQAADFLGLLDKAHSLFHRLEAKGVDLRAERTRWETIEGQLDSRARVLVREVEKAGGLEQLRETTEPTPDRWWWFLDDKVRRQQKRLLRRCIITGSIALMGLIIAALLYQRFLAPDPLTVKRFRLERQAEQAIQQGDLESALTHYQALRKLAPDDPQVILGQGVLYEVLGQEQLAEQAYARARELLGNRQEFFTTRGMIYLELDQWEAAQSDSEAALALNPESALAYFILGNAHEAQGQLSEALKAFEQAADLALAQEDNSFYALIKFRLGVLMGSSP